MFFIVSNTKSLRDLAFHKNSIKIRITEAIKLGITHFTSTENGTAPPVRTATTAHPWTVMTLMTLAGT